MGREHIPGIVVGVYHRGQVLMAKGYGLANIELNVPVRPEMLFQTGSVGKQFTSMAVMMLVEQGHVALDDCVAEFVPAFGRHGKHDVRIRHLLTHTSGLPDMLPNNEALRAAHSPPSLCRGGPIWPRRWRPKAKRKDE